jgi:hypothetical protein
MISEVADTCHSIDLHVNQQDMVLSGTTTTNRRTGALGKMSFPCRFSTVRKMNIKSHLS